MFSPTSPPRRLLIVRNDRLGDLIMTLPALQYARRVWPETEICVLVSPRTAPLLCEWPDVDHVILDEPGTSARQLAGRLRPSGFDTAIVICPKTRNYLATWLAGIRTRVTWGTRPAGLILGNRRVWLRRSHPPIHEARFALAFLQRLHVVPDYQPNPLTWSADESTRGRVRDWIETRLGGEGPLFGIHPGSYGSSHNWPPELYAQLIAKLCVHGRVLVTGGPGERRLLEELLVHQPTETCDRVAINWDFDLLELGAAISLMDCLTVSNTGPMHLAGLIGTPLVALFSYDPSQSAAKWAPLGDRWTILEPELSGEAGSSIRENTSDHMRGISVDRVLQAVLAWIDTTDTDARTRATGEP